MAELHAAQVKDSCCLYLQPEWSKASEMMEEIVGFVKENPKWSVSLQTHKFMNILNENSCTHMFTDSHNLVEPKS